MTKKSTFIDQNHPQNPQRDTLGTQIRPQKVIFGHLIDFGHFPIEIPIVVEKNNLIGKERSQSKNKNSTEICEQSRTTWQHAQSKIPNFVKIRITLLHQLLLNINLVGFFIKSNLAALLDI